MKHITRTKICGMKSIDDIEMAARCGADAVGFIVDVPVNTPRKISAKKAMELVSNVSFFMDSVLVIMPESGDQVVSMVETIKPDLVQIHRDFSIEDLEYVKDHIDIPIVKTYSIKSGSSSNSFNEAQKIVEKVDNLNNKGLVDGILLDSRTDVKVGGSGTIHDWSISKTVVDNVDLPVVLAGGLSPDNVRNAVHTVSPYAVDTSSGVETNGRKDGDKICRFISEARCV